MPPRMNPTRQSPLGNCLRRANELNNNSPRRNFDQIYDLGLVFVLADLAYFIALENEDYEKRSRLARDAMMKNAFRRG